MRTWPPIASREWSHHGSQGKERSRHCRSSSTLSSSVHWDARQGSEVRDLHIIIVLRLSVDVWLFGTELIGLKDTQSILDRWKDDAGKHKYTKLCPDDPRSKSYPCKSEADGRAVVMLVSNMLRLDATHPYKAGTGHDPLRPGNVPLALFGASSPKYSQLGCYMLVEFWCKRSTLGPLSSVIAFNTPTEVDLAFEQDWKM